jgi:serine protease
MFKPGTATVDKAAALGEGGAPRGRAELLARRAGVPLTAGHEVAERMQVVKASGMTSDALARRLAEDPDVLFAVPDKRRRKAAVPNDPLYAAGVPGNGPAVGQWYLRTPEGEVVSSIDAEGAWNVTTGSPAIVVAVVDTGVRFEHPDLRRASEGGNLLPGFDMISDLDIANDGSGRDPDPSDPGDWVSEAEYAAVGGPFEDCPTGAADSSWHGTQLAGLIGAVTNNALGMASVGRSVRVLPVRVFGKCTAFDSDIIAGMRWAAGLPVPGVPINQTPARVISLSIGGPDSCDFAYRTAVDEILAAGAVIVAAAGNDAHRTWMPGNCAGVVAVAGLRHVGTKVGFSNLGPEIALSAPGGNCINVEPDAPCLYPILTTSNAGTTTPGASIYTDSYNASVGTSYAAPLVAGTAALMLSVRPTLTPAQVRSFLQGTTRPFPPRNAGDPTVPACTSPQYEIGGQPIEQFECHCTTSTCGAGMLDAGAAVRAAQAGVTVAGAIEYYNESLDHYFLTWLPAEIAILDAGTQIRGWRRTGLSIPVWTTPAVGTSPVCRYYIPPALGDSHFYGRGTAECEATGNNHPTFQNEDARFMHMALPSAGVCPASTTPVYRLFSDRPDANHRYTTSGAIRDQMVAKGWLAEGDGPDRVVMCGPR